MDDSPRHISFLREYLIALMIGIIGSLYLEYVVIVGILYFLDFIDSNWLRVWLKVIVQILVLIGYRENMQIGIQKLYPIHHRSYYYSRSCVHN